MAEPFCDGDVGRIAMRTQQIQLRLIAASCILVTACFDGELENFALEVGGSGGLAPDSSSSDASTSATSSGMGGAPQDLLVDDFEDGDTRANDDFGWWYATNDTTGDQDFRVAEVFGRPEGMRAANSSGSGFRVWGALVGLDLTEAEGAYDGSAFGELRFWARAAPDTVTSLSARLLEGSLQFEKPIELSSEWQEYVLEFQALSAVDGSDRIIDSSRLTALQFFVLSDGSFDFWIDDVVFAGQP